MAGLTRRNDTWHLRMRVPRRYASVEPRSELHRSLKTGDRNEAEARVGVVRAQVIAELDARLAGRDTPGSRSHYETLARLATDRGFSYRTAEELAGGDLKDILRRTDALAGAGDKPDSAAAAALLGGVERPRETICEVAARMHEIRPLEYAGRTHAQSRIWMNRWKGPARKMRELLGRDAVFLEVPRSDAVAFRDALRDRVLEGEIQGKTAQGNIENLNRMWKLYQLNLGADPADVPPSPWRGLTEGLAALDEEGRKSEIPVASMRRMIEPGAMASMNDELRDLLLVLCETGCRQAEVSDIEPSFIRLDEKIPHILLKRQAGEFARRVKNKHSSRPVPLVGVALEAMRRNPKGFPRYRGKATFSAAANKSLRAAGLLADGVTIGGLRHSFESRLKAAGVKSDDRGELMGQSVSRARNRPQYGDSMALEQRLEFHRMIELTPPDAPG